MKNQFNKICLTLLAGVLVACNAHQNNDKPFQHKIALNEPVALSDTFSRFILKDSANRMLGSYLTSINYQQNDTDLRSLIINVKQLRRYIDSMPNSADITELKLMFAHTLNYTNSPRVNMPAGYRSNALTIIIAAYKANGDYVFYDGNKVLDYTRPCPPECPPGNAGNAFLIQ